MSTSNTGGGSGGSQAPGATPPTGSLPGFATGKELVGLWASMLERQADIWNTHWNALLGGNYKIEDWFKAVGKSLQASSSTAERMWQAWGGTAAAPPWASLSWPGNEVFVTLRHPLRQQDNLAVSQMSRLGGDPPANSVPIEIIIRKPKPDSGVLALSVNSLKGKPASGQYIGFLMSDKRADPLVIITVAIA